MNENDVARIVAAEKVRQDAEEVAVGPRIDYGTDTWRNVENYLKQQIALRQAELEDPRVGSEMTAYIRGQIAAYREIVELAVKQKLLDSGQRNFKVSA